MKPEISDAHCGFVEGFTSINLLLTVNLCYTYDNVLKATSQKKLQQMVDTVVAESEKLGLNFNNRK